ncbi:hypothetical protein GDO81_018265 [Engystomops pustulosus]|uniref:Uncharacterized protein n=1 Tax=Engystomops pustulosus TaxID=76066 RepID=A0AAV7ABT1_ENGPU|nr:hypothetical protein GDO81_018265 [Engystomops pustulosus]
MSGEKRVEFFWIVSMMAKEPLSLFRRHASWAKLSVHMYKEIQPWQSCQYLANFSVVYRDCAALFLITPSPPDLVCNVNTCLNMESNFREGLKLLHVLPYTWRIIEHPGATRCPLHPFLTTAQYIPSYPGVDVQQWIPAGTILVNH